MGALRGVIGRIVRKDMGDFYASVVYTLVVAFVGFLLFKLGDLHYGLKVTGAAAKDHPYGLPLGYLVHDYPWLQYVFQSCAFIGLGLAVDLYWQYHKARKASQEVNGATSKKIRGLVDEIEKRDMLLLAEKERYRKIIDMQTELVTKYLPDGTITFVNRANYTFHGHDSHEAMIGASIFDYMEKTQVIEVKRALRGVTVDNPRERHVEVMVGRGGKPKYIDWVNCGIFDATGRVVKFQSVGRDITEMVQLSKQVEQKEKYYRLLFTHMLSGFAVHRIICDDEDLVCDYAFIDINPAFEELFGFGKDEVIGKTVLEIMPNTEPNIITRFGRVAETGNADVFECWFPDINKWFNVTAFKPQDEHFAATYIDITQRKDRTGKKDRCTDNPQM